MLIWRVVLYVLGTIFALRSLVSLMTNHHRNFERKMRKAAAPKGKPPAEPANSETGSQGSVAA